MEAVKTEICLSEASLFPFSLQQTALAQPGAVLIFASFHQGKEGATLHKGRSPPSHGKRRRAPLHKGKESYFTLLKINLQLLASEPVPCRQNQVITGVPSVVFHPDTFTI